jgi:uncharacterized protein (UPF0297 family)
LQEEFETRKEVLTMMDRNTILFDGNPEKSEQPSTNEILRAVYDALEEKGYNSIDQMVGYILSGDPSYITSHNNARNLIRHIERDDLVEELLRNFLTK